MAPWSRRFNNAEQAKRSTRKTRTWCACPKPQCGRYRFVDKKAAASDLRCRCGTFFQQDFIPKKIKGEDNLADCRAKILPEPKMVRLLKMIGVRIVGAAVAAGQVKGVGAMLQSKEAYLKENYLQVRQDGAVSVFLEAAVKLQLIVESE